MVKRSLSLPGILHKSILHSLPFNFYTLANTRSFVRHNVYAVLVNGVCLGAQKRLHGCARSDLCPGLLPIAKSSQGGSDYNYPSHRCSYSQTSYLRDSCTGPDIETQDMTENMRCKREGADQLF